MRILIITTENGTDGGGLSLSCTRVADLLSVNHDVEIVSSTDYPIDVAKGCALQSIDDSILKEFKLKSDANRYNYVDVVIGFGGNYNGYYASLLAERMNKTYILCLRGTDINLCKWTIENSMRLRMSCHRARKIVCLSNEMINNVSSIVPEARTKCVIIPNDIRIMYEGVRLPNLPRRIVLGCAATHLNEKKGISNLLDMVASFKQISSTPIELQLVGRIDDDLLEQYQIKAQSIGIATNIIYKGFENRERLKQTMRNWDFYIQGSVCEGHPNAIVEALQSGTAFISTSTGWVAESLMEEFPMLFFNSFNPTEMSKQLKSLVDDTDLQNTYKSAANKLNDKLHQSKVKESWEKVVSISVPTSSICTDQIFAVGLHDVAGDTHDSITTPTDVFEQFVTFIHNQGYGLCSMKDYMSMDKEDRKRYIVCTFDDGYKTLVANAAPILHKYSFSATVFVCTSLIGKDNTWNSKDSKLRQHLDMGDLTTLKDLGWEIASHGVNHRNLLKLSDKDLICELSQSHDIICKMVGDTSSYAYPYGAYNEFIKQCVGQYYRYAFAVSQGGTSLVADSLQIRRYSITEIYKILAIES